MPNVNSVAGFAQQGSSRNQWPSQAIASTTETQFVISTDGGTANFFLTPPSATGVYGAQSNISIAANPAVTGRSGREYGLPSGESNQGWNTTSLLPGRLFKVRLVGTGNAGANAAQSAIINLYQGTSATIASDKKIGTTGAALAMVAGGAFNFSIEATLLWDNTSQILSGYYTSNIAFGSTSQFTTTTVVSNVVTGVTASGLSFLGTITMGNGAASTVQLSEFSLDQE